MDQFIKGMAG